MNLKYSSWNWRYFRLARGDFVPLHFDVLTLYDVNCGLVDDIALSGSDELAGDDGFKGLQQGRQGLARFQNGAIYGMDLLDVAVAFDEEDMIDFLGLYATADKAKDDFSPHRIPPFCL